VTAHSDVEQGRPASDNGLVFDEVWASAGGRADQAAAVTVRGPEHVLPSVFDVTGLAAATSAIAGLAAAVALSARTGEAVRPVSVDRRAAAAAFASERLFTPVGWRLPDPWDLVAGDYRAADGWIRLHTNYAHHRAAVARVVGRAEHRDEVAGLVARWSAGELESAVVAAGGCAAAMHDQATWRASAAGSVAAREPLVRVDVATSAEPGPAAGAARRPYQGVRVLDLTRVIAGPVATRFLAAHGADVLRVDPPGFAEIPALVPDVTAGKRCTALDLGSAGGRTTFERLLGMADVLVCGLRPGVLDRLGYGPDDLRDRHPGLVVACLDAYGHDGPWKDRRGFDSLVQMSCGIAAAGTAASGVDRPVPLPVQALDHGTGYLLAAAIGLALARRWTDGATSHIRASLVGTANLLQRHPAPEGLAGPAPLWTDTDTVPSQTAWGAARRAPVPVRIDGVEAIWDVNAGPLGRDEPRWR
jgi:hypothetical protein